VLFGLPVVAVMANERARMAVFFLIYNGFWLAKIKDFLTFM
jgi:hypothetical protein